MVSRPRGVVEERESEYLKTEIESDDDRRQWHALQRICKLYNNGKIISSQKCTQLEIAIRGVLGGKSVSKRILHWGLAALAYVGKSDSAACVSGVLKKYDDDPDILFAGIAALLKFDPQNAKTLVNVGQPELVTLASLQVLKADKLNKFGFKTIRININKSSVDSLKSALLLIGMGKAPENIFESNYSNAEIVKILGTHDDSIVRQYTVWAALENPNLGIQDIGLDIKNIEDFPENVREYIYRLIAGKASGAWKEAYSDCVIFGIEDENSKEARLGLAIGLRDSFRGTLSPNIYQWYYNEKETEIRAAILDHMVAQAERAGDYKQASLDEYKRANNNFPKRTRMKAAAQGTSLFAEFKKIDIEEEGGNLLERNMTLNFNGDTNIGALSTAGNADNGGSVRQANNVRKLYDGLDQLKDEIENIPTDKIIKQEALNQLKEAQQNPNKGLLTKLEKKLTEFSNIATSTAALVAYVPALERGIEMVGRWIGLV